MELLYEDETYRIRSAILEVYRTLGAGFLESVYQEALEKEFMVQKLPFKAQPELVIKYKDQALTHTFRPDFVCFDKIILELKSVKDLLPQHEAQVFNYLRASQMRLGMLINFSNYPKVKIKRIILPKNQ